MLGFIDKKIESYMKRGLYRKRDKIVAKTVDEFAAAHKLDEAKTEELRTKLIADTDRFIKIVDRSVLRAGLIRARYVFWVTAILGTVLVLALASYPPTTGIAPFFVPLIAALVGWAVSVATIPISYIESLKGVRDATIASFEKELLEQQENELRNSNDPSVHDLKQMLLQLKQQVEQLSKHDVETVPPPVPNESYSDFTAASLSASTAGMWQARSRPEEKTLLTSNSRVNPLP